MNLSDIGEFGLIARWRNNLAQRDGVRLGIGDDAAVLDALHLPIVTCDALVEDVHFRLDWSTPRQIGRKAIAVNVSDIAAMGGRPVAAFVALAVPSHISPEFLDELYAGMEESAAEYSLTIAGGDLTRAPASLTLAITIVGEAARPVTRGGARPGDLLVVTGTLGDAAAGLKLLQHPALPVSAQARELLLRRHREPVARLGEMTAALAMGGEAIHAALDLSDGLSGDAAHIAERSNVTVEIETAHLPISALCREAAALLGRDPLDWALTGGEDYELLLCVAPDSAEAVSAAIAAKSTPATIIGRCVAGGNGVVLINESGRSLKAPPAFRHF